MGAANGEVIREPFDTKPSDQWVGCLLISLRSKGVVRRNCVVGYREMLCKWAADPIPGPCLPHQAPCIRIWPRTVILVPCPGAHQALWICPRHCLDATQDKVGTAGDDCPSLSPAERGCLCKTCCCQDTVFDFSSLKAPKPSSGCKPCPSQAPGCPASVWPAP